MNKTYIFLAAFSVSAGVSLASGPGSKKNEVPPPPKHRSEVEEFMVLEQQQSILQTQRLSASDRDPAQEQPEHNFYDEKYPSRLGEIDLDKKTFDMKDEEETSSKGTTRNDDTETIGKGTTRNDDAVRAAQNGVTRFTHNVREALPPLLFSVVMGALTVNEMHDRDGPDAASIIPLSGMAVLGVIQAYEILRSGQSSVYNMVPRTVGAVMRTAWSLIPGVAYSAYHHFTDSSTPTISNATKQCVKQCLERQ